MLGNLTPEEIDDFLDHQSFAHLGCHADGKTYVVPISFAYQDGRMVGQTMEGLKIDMLRKNPECCIQVEKINGIADWTSVIAWGRFEELSGKDAIEAMGILIDHLGPQIEALGSSRSPRDVTPSGESNKNPTKILYCIRISEKSGRFETSQ